MIGIENSEKIERIIKMMKKRFFTLMLSVLLVFALAACGNNQAEKSTGSTEPDSGTTSQTEEDVEPEVSEESSEKTDSIQTGNEKCW